MPMRMFIIKEDEAVPVECGHLQHVENHDQTHATRLATCTHKLFFEP